MLSDLAQPRHFTRLVFLGPLASPNLARRSTDGEPWAGDEVRTVGLESQKAASMKRTGQDVTKRSFRTHWGAPPRLAKAYAGGAD